MLWIPATPALVLPREKPAIIRPAMLSLIPATWLAAQPAAGGGPATIAFGGGAQDSTDISAPSSYTFGTVGIGTASSDRYIAVGVGIYGGSISVPVISSVTVAGQATTSVGTTAGSQCRAAIYITSSPVTSGTTASIVVNFTTNTALGCGVAAYALKSLSSTTATATNNTTSDNSAMSLTVNSSGVAFAYSIAQGGAGGPGTNTWTGVTEDLDTVIQSGESAHTSGSTSSSGTLSITSDWNGTIANPATFCAAFR